MPRICALITICSAELFLTAWAVLIVGVVSVWPMDDDLVTAWQATDWIRRALLRAVCAVAAATLLGFAIGLANRWCLRGEQPVFVRWLPILSACLVAVTGIAGSAWFLIDRPFL